MGLEAIIGLTPEDIEYAYSLGNKYGNAKVGGGVGNRGDAARHIALGFLAANADAERFTGPYWSQNLVQYKEDFDSLGRRRDVESAMDVHNNRVGFEAQAIVGNDRAAFEKLLDELMPKAIMMKSIDDIPEGPDKPFAPVYIQSGYKLYKGGGKAD